MILILSYKQWDKYKKKLVEPKDYVIMDAMGDDSTNLQAYVNAVTTSDIVPPPRLVHMIKEEDFDSAIDEDAVRELERTFFSGLKFRTTALAIIKNAVSDDINTFIVLNNIVFKFWNGRYRKEFIKLVPEIEDNIYVMTKKFDGIKDLLEEPIGSGKRSKINSSINKVENELEKEHKEKKKKHKKKSKNKKKFNGFGFEEWW